MDVGNMHALRLLLVTQCPLHSQDERLTGRTGAVAAVDDRIAYLQTVALSQVLDVVSHRAVSCSSCSSVQRKYGRLLGRGLRCGLSNSDATEARSAAKLLLDIVFPSF